MYKLAAIPWFLFSVSAYEQGYIIKFLLLHIIISLLLVASEIKKIGDKLEK